jgi:hypothetical protein
MKMRLAMAGIGLAVTACIVAFCISPSRITYESYQQIRVGMSRPQVERILGGPARQEVKASPLSSYIWERLPGTEEWWGEEGVISVRFDAADKASEKLFSEHRTILERPSLVAKVRRLLPW